jgi:hypothetical protein
MRYRLLEHGATFLAVSDTLCLPNMHYSPRSADEAAVMRIL